MEDFEIIHRVDGRLRAVVIRAESAEQAEAKLLAHHETRGWSRPEMVNTEAMR